MEKFDAIIKKYKEKGVSIDNIEYAIDSAKEGTKREHALENLTADYRGMEYELANSMLEDIYTANGGEFKKENKNGYLFGVFFLMVGLSCSYYIFHVFYFGGVLVRPIVVGICAIGGVGAGLYFILMSMRGKYRNHMEPFQGEN